MNGEKLRRYGLATAALFLIVCAVSIAQHWPYVAEHLSAFIWGVVGKTLSLGLTLLLLIWILRLFLGGKR